MNGKKLRTICYGVFAVSGFAGLIYESIWTHYLKLFLGHAAYAQTLVLIIFMGGLALGSWLCSKFSMRWRNLLRGYALAEAIIGIFAFFFHPVFTAFEDLAYTTLFPALGSVVAISACKWIGAGLLIVVQTVLLGTTFPLMTSGLVRRYPESPGRTIAMLYFANSMGAAVGVLASGFLLIGWVGLPGTLQVAGVINLVLAAVVWVLGGKGSPGVTPRPDVETGPIINSRFSYVFFLIVALLTGMASFIYEVGWIRMLSLVLGSSTQAFELMLSAFILGLALGGLWIWRRIDHFSNPAGFLGWVQLAMGTLALMTLPLYGESFRVMQWLVQNLEKTETGFHLFNLGSHTIALAVMLPATFCAGMTLPLITFVLLRAGHGEKCIGAVYASNTIGAIFGVVLAVHLGMPWLGVKGLIIAGAFVDLALGLVIVWWAIPASVARQWATVATVCVLTYVIFGVQLEPHKMASGVYRSGTLLNAADTKVLFHRDGKTASISITRHVNGETSIRTNGKTDAAIQMIEGVEESSDEHTMVFLGALGLVLHPQAKIAANIGMGSGLTSEVLLSTTQLERLDTIEIEPVMVEAAEYFRPRVSRPFDDPRSHIFYEDAKTFFSLHNVQYDLIISEPSNPWVSGVASLFSTEFYRRIRGHLRDDGMLLQWLPLYEIDLPLVASILKALSPHFQDYAIYASDFADVLIVARPVGAVPPPHAAALQAEGLREQFERISIRNVGDIELRRLANKRVLTPLMETFSIPANSDYYPVLDLGAMRARFLGASAKEFLDPDLYRVPALEMLGGLPPPRGEESTFESYFERSVHGALARSLFTYVLGGEWNWDHKEPPLPPNIMTYARQARAATSSCNLQHPKTLWFNGMYNSVAKRIVPFLSSQDLQTLWQRIESPECWSQLDPIQKDFFRLLQAVGHRDGPTMAKKAERLLQVVRNTDPYFTEYLLSIGMLGYLVSGDKQAAATLWSNYNSAPSMETPRPLLMRLLMSHSRLSETL